MLIPSDTRSLILTSPSLSRRVNANSRLFERKQDMKHKLIKKGEC